jgi:acetyltransferase-like isoleucine patch superfamily enzyme/acyl carrier protein
VIAALWTRLWAGVGPRARIIGRPTLQGDVAFGSDLVLSSRPVRSHLIASPGAKIRVGDRVSIASGAAIAASVGISIGSDVEIGQGVMILDTDFHDVADFEAESTRSPVVIEDGVSLGDRVVVLKGARIGKGARVLEGSVVSGFVAEGAIVAGVPARAVRGKANGETASGDRAILDRVKAVVAETFRVDRPVDDSDGPGAIVEWDSLGILRLALGLEDELGVQLADDALYGALTVSEVAERVTKCYRPV